MTYSFREKLSQILSTYMTAREEAFSGHQLASMIRNDLPQSLKQHCIDTDQYLWHGSAGKGNWARAPWLAVFDVLVTSSAQSGYYVVYLFREDMTGVYLSINQGVTEVREKYQAQAKEALKVRAADYVAQLGGLPSGFECGQLDLRPSAASNLLSYYEFGNICARFYPADQIPDEAVLAADFQAALTLYDILSYNETVPVGSGLHEEDEDKGVLFEDLRKIRHHKRVERNARLSDAAKKVQGYVCKLCGFDFEATYGEIGHRYIEAHHLTPISELKGKIVRLDPAKDFTVLCANCHRMIHRCDAPHDIDGFRDKYM